MAEFHFPETKCAKLIFIQFNKYCAHTTFKVLFLDLQNDQQVGVPDLDIFTAY